MCSIHDGSNAAAAVETETDSSFDPLDSSSDSGQSSTTKEVHFGRGAIKAGKSGALGDMEERSNFYPITWRVIGGGVMMSGPREFLISFSAHPQRLALCRGNLSGLYGRQV